MNHDLYICLEFVIAQYNLECILDKNKSLLLNLKIIKELVPKLKNYDFNDILIYEKYTNICLDPKLSLDELGLYDGITLLIY